MTEKSKKLYELTPEHRAQLAPWADRWIENALRTSPQTNADRDATRVAIRGLYGAAGQPAPSREVFCASPISAAIAASAASCVWWLRRNPNRHNALFGRVLTEAEIMRAAMVAVTVAVSRGRAATDGTPVPTLPAMATRAATDDAANAATRDTTDDATSEATSDATRDTTSAVTRAATSAATSDATRDTTYAATDDATRAATDAATREATRAATYAATSAATRDTTYAATRDATCDTTSEATSEATSDATSAATSAVTRAATSAATSAATRDTTYAATRDTTDDATSEATSAATSDAMDDATYAATDDPIVCFVLGCLPRWSSMWNGGNQWSGWVAYLSFFRHVAKLPIDYSLWSHYEAAAIHAGPRYMHADFWIASDFPTTIKRDERCLPHCATGPALAWRDGWALYYWHGVRVPRAWIEAPTTIDPSLALTHPNVEQRRCLAEILGWGKVLEHVATRTIDTDLKYGTLIECELDGNRERFLRVRCPTGRDFVLAVPPNMRTGHEAVAWTYGKTPATYNPETRT